MEERRADQRMEIDTSGIEKGRSPPSSLSTRYGNCSQGMNEE